MKTELKYLIIKDKVQKGTLCLETNELNGYQLIKNRKKNINGVNIYNVLIVDHYLITKVIDKKVSRKFKTLLELIAGVYESDEDPSSSMRYVLNEIEKFKRIMINQYVNYMDKKQVEKLNRKLKLIEQEVSIHMYQYNQQYEENVYEEEKSSHRRR